MPGSCTPPSQEIRYQFAPFAPTTRVTLIRLDMRDKSSLTPFMTVDLRQVVAQCGTALGHSQAAVKKWLQRGKVPYRWRMHVIAMAGSRGYRLTWDDLDTIDGRTVSHAGDGDILSRFAQEASFS